MTTFTGSVNNAVIRQGVPAVPTTAFRVSCPTCHHAADVPARAAGRVVKCPKCRESFTAAPAQVSSDDTSRTGIDSETFGVAASATPPSRRHSNGRTVVNNDGGRRRLILAAVVVAVLALAGGGWWYKVRADRYEAMLADRTECMTERMRCMAMMELRKAWRRLDSFADTPVIDAEVEKCETRMNRLVAEYKARYGADAPDLKTLHPGRWSQADLLFFNAEKEVKMIGERRRGDAVLNARPYREAGMSYADAKERAERECMQQAVAEANEVCDRLAAEYAAIR